MSESISYQHIEVRPIAGYIGAEIGKVDLSRPSARVRTFTLRRPSSSAAAIRSRRRGILQPRSTDLVDHFFAGHQAWGVNPSTWTAGARWPMRPIDQRILERFAAPEMATAPGIFPGAVAISLLRSGSA